MGSSMDYEYSHCILFGVLCNDQKSSGCRDIKNRSNRDESCCSNCPSTSRDHHGGNKKTDFKRIATRVFMKSLTHPLVDKRQIPLTKEFRLKLTPHKHAFGPRTRQRNTGSTNYGRLKRMDIEHIGIGGQYI